MWTLLLELLNERTISKVPLGLWFWTFMHWKKMSEVLSLAIYHDVFTLPWPSWLAAREATAKASGAEARRWVVGGQKVLGRDLHRWHTQPISFPETVQWALLVIQFQCSRSQGALVMISALLNSWCSKGNPRKFALGVTYCVLVTFCFA